MAETTTPTKASRASGKRLTGSGEVEECVSTEVQNQEDGQATPSGSTYDLGPLNRHWYRRCLDALDERLRESSTNPSINELKDLCDSVVTGFLTAVTGQAPDSSRLQFPADRAYFIPFEGDLAERFNFSKPFYRLKGEPSDKDKERLYEHSVWSFYPWTEGGTRIEIDNQRSVDGDGKTIPFEEMISVRAQFVGEEAEQVRTSTGTQSPLLLEKSLVLRGEDRSYLGGLFAADDRRGEAARQALYESCAVAMRAIFDVYRMTPGNVAVESILLNHVTVIRWLLAMLVQERKDTQEGKVVLVAEQDEDFKNLFLAFLRHFFFGSRLDGRLSDNEEKRVKDLFNVLDSRDREVADEAQREASGDRQARVDFYTERAKKGGNPFSAQVAQLRKSQEGSAGETGDPFQTIEADLRNFRQYLLSVTSEERIENDLAAALEDSLLKAGDSRQSFIWVIPDFERIDDSVPQRFEVQKRTKAEVHALSGPITEAYKAFYERFDSVCVGMGDRRKKLEAYWRTLGQANREQLVFSSFKDSSVGLHVAEIAAATKVGALRKKSSNRPQNFFLRIKICDSLNEPVINGLFILSTDHDEVSFKGKKQDLRKEDQEDLLAFGKVYFFIVRDYFRALDQSQAARDIGQLNQYLYDKRLGDLDQRMQRRIETQAGGIADEKNWPLFTYEILNNYAFSLIEKPEDVQSETFPYDRLLVLPLGEERKGSDYDLPFYLFQALFAERQAGEIQSGLYSLIKPFQSPVEENEEAGERFRVKSFQKVSKTSNQGQEVRLERYLEKIYLSAQEQSFGGADAGKPGKEPGARRQAAVTASTEPESFVVKLLREGKDSPDHGRDWVVQAVDSFWSRFGPQDWLELWRSFLNNLTESFKQLGRSDRTSRESGEEQWFLLRLGLLRVLLSGRSKREERIEVIRRAYDNDLKLRFNNDRSLDVVKWATDEDPFTKLAERLSHLAERLEIQFEPFTLRGEDPFVLAFFRHLTNLVCNRYETEKEDAEKGWTNGSQATWYQPLLTRPLEVSGEGRVAEGISSNLALHVAAGQKIKHRLPPYEQIEAGRHALSMFLGVVNFSIGQGKQRARLRCLVAMIRDYDDAQTGTDFTQKERQQLEVDRKEREQQLEVDRRDLSLYTTTFFRNVQKFVKDAMAREENKVLSTDISQIARNWYSSGMDRISLRLRQHLDQLLEDRTDFRFGGLRPEIVDTFFDGILEVLLRTEERPGVEGKDILLESFPFDRLLHIPLGLGSVSGARLCYARTRIVDARPDEGDMDRWGSLGARQCYERIRRNGRTWPQSNGRKTAEQIHHFEFADERLANSEDLAALMRRIGQPRLLDSLVRSLYEANAIQTLAIAGLLLQLLGNGENSTMRQRLEAVVADSIRSVEQQASSAAESSIHTEVYMDREAILCQLSAKGYDGSDADLRRDLQNIRLLPAWYDFFKAVEKPLEEKTPEDFVYGLRGTQQNEILSKLFYVYYSIEAPHTFTEVPAMGSRFRGILALVLDDASTDLKSEIGEIADQQDIRTFVHNGVRSLQLILENQGLANRLRQPGIERFVLGMLHRLKNELGKPMAVLHTLKESSRSENEIEQIERATSAIDGLRGLFKSLRGLEDVQQGIVPIRPFSTHWLGWLFIAKLTVAALKAAEGLALDPNQAKDAKDALQDLERIRKLAESELKVEPRDPLRAVDVIQREIKNVESAMRKLVAGRAGIGPADVVLSYQVFSETPLEFLGSFHLEEALNILIENAFQAFWDHLDHRSGKAAKSGLLRMICRQSRERSGEILIEISNSTTPIDRSVLLVLNDRVAQPMTQQQHASKSGKKGGSGFGHYYARRTVSELCGGREARRELDVKIDYLEETGLARIRVNLIEASSRGLQPLSAEQVQAEVRRNFDREFALGLETAGGYHLPQNIDARSLFNLIRRLLVADREALENAFLSWWRSRVCSMLSDRCDNLRKRLLDRLTALADTDPEGCERWREILGQIQTDGVAKVRRSSFHDLRRFLQQVRDRGDGSLVQIIQGNELMERLLRSFATGSNGFELEPQSLIDPGEKEKVAKELERYKLHLKKDLDIKEVPRLLLEDIDQDERGRPVPSGDGVASLLEPSHWRLDRTIRKGNLHLAVSLVDGSPIDVKIDLSQTQPMRLEITSEDYQIEHQTFQSYSRLFERTLREGAPVGLLWMEVPAKEPRRTVHLVLSGASKQ